MSGGKFANGAITGAFLQVFNNEMTERKNARLFDRLSNSEKQDVFENLRKDARNLAGSLENGDQQVMDRLFINVSSDLEGELWSGGEGLRSLQAAKELRTLAVKGFSSEMNSNASVAVAVGESAVKNFFADKGNLIQMGSGMAIDYFQSQSGISTSHFIACPGGSCEAYLIIGNQEVYKVY